MVLIKQPFSDKDKKKGLVFGLFKKKDHGLKEQSHEEKLKGYERLEKELQESKLEYMKKVEEKEMVFRKKEEVKPVEEHKVEFIRPEYKATPETIPEPPKLPRFEPEQEEAEEQAEEGEMAEITPEQRLAILEQNLLAVADDLNKRVTALEQFVIKNFR